MAIVKCLKYFYLTLIIQSPVGFHCRIHRQNLCRGVRPTPNGCPVYEIKLSNGKVPVLEILGIWNTPSLPLLPCPLRPGVVAPARGLSMVPV